MTSRLFRRAALGALAFAAMTAGLLAPAAPAAAQFEEDFRDLPYAAESCAACPFDESARIYDSDFDGLFDFDEGYYGTDPFSPDTDGDGYTDPYELFPCSGGVATNPLDPADFFDPIGCLH